MPKTKRLRCKCQDAFEDEYRWWTCDVHGRMTAVEYEEEIGDDPEEEPEEEPKEEKEEEPKEEKEKEPKTKKKVPSPKPPEEEDNEEEDNEDNEPPKHKAKKQVTDDSKEPIKPYGSQRWFAGRT